MIPPGGGVRTSLPNDVIDLLLISRAMYGGGISKFTVAISIFSFLAFYDYSSKGTKINIVMCSLFSLWPQHGMDIYLSVADYVHVS